MNLLIENGGCLLQKDQAGLSPLEELVKNDYCDLFSCVYKKIVHSARDMSDLNSFSLMHFAAGIKNSRCLHYLLEQEGEPANCISNNHDKETPLNFAIVSENIENVKLLLRYGANVNHKDSSGNTALHLAVMTGNLNIVKLLDQYNADATVENGQGSSAIDISMQLH